MKIAFPPVKQIKIYKWTQADPYNFILLSVGVNDVGYACVVYRGQVFEKLVAYRDIHLSETIFTSSYERTVTNNFVLPTQQQYESTILNKDYDIGYFQQLIPLKDERN